MNFTKLAMAAIASIVLTSAAYAQELKTVQLVSSLRGVSFLPVYAAMENGYFKEAGLAVQHSDVSTSALVAAALSSGKAQFGAMQPDVVIAIDSQGGDIKILANLVGELPYKLIVRSDVNKIEDLAGKRIGSVAPNNGNEIAARWILDKSGLKGKVQYSPTGPQASLLAALTAGQIEGAMLVSPWSVQALQSGMRQLLDSADYIKGVSAGSITASASHIESDPQTVQKFVGAVIKGAKWMIENEDAATTLLAEKVSMSPEDAKLAYDQGRRAMSADGRINEQGITEWVNITFGYKGETPNITVDQIYDPSFLKGQ